MTEEVEAAFNSSKAAIEELAVTTAAVSLTSEELAVSVATVEVEAETAAAAATVFIVTFLNA